MQIPFQSKFPAVAYGQVFDDEEYQPIIKFATTCCAMCILSIKDYHTKEEIQETIKSIKTVSDSKKWKPSDRSGGEKNIMTIISPGEENLEKNLISLGFTLINQTMKRRKGYPNGLLKMYLLTI